MVAPNPRISGTPVPEDNVSESAVRGINSAQTQIELIRSFQDHFERTEAFNQAMLTAVKEMNSVTQSAVMFASNDTERRAAQERQSAIKSEMGLAMSTGMYPEASGGNPAALEDAVDPSSIAPITKQQGIPAVKSQYKGPDDFRAGRRQGLSGARAAVSDMAARGIQNATAGGAYFEETEISYNETLGRFFDGEGNEVDDSIAQRAFSGESFFRNTMTGEIADESFAASAMKRAAAGAAIRKGVTAYGGGSSLGASVGAAIPKVGKAAGAAGVAVGTVMELQNRIEAQTAKNVRYQQVLGGGNFQGYGERLRGQAFDLQGFNPFNPADTTAIYSNALNLYSGDRNMRDSYQEQAVRLAGSTGMDAREVDAVFRRAKENGIESLAEIASALEDVSSAAKEAGTSAVEARAAYLSAFDSYGALMNGTSVSILAQSQAESIVNGYGSVSSEVTIGGNQRQISRTLAARSGMTPNQITDLAEVNPQAYAAMQDSYNTEMVPNILGAPAMEIIQRFMQENGISPGDAVDEATIEELVSLLRQDSRVPQEEIVANAIGRITNEIVPPDRGFYQAIAILFRGNSRSEGIAAEQASLQQGTFEDLDKGKILDYMTESPGGLDLNPFNNGAVNTRQGMGEAYYNYAQTNNVQDPLIERLLEKAREDDAFTKNSRFTVQTADGEQTVNIDDLFDNYLDQVSSGGVKVATDGNRDLAESLGLIENRDSSVEVTSASEGARGRDRSGDVQGTIIIQMAPEMEQFFRIQSTQGLSVQTSPYVGTQSWTSDGRPTG